MLSLVIMMRLILNEVQNGKIKLNIMKEEIYIDG